MPILVSQARILVVMSLITDCYQTQVSFAMPLASQLSPLTLKDRLRLSSLKISFQFTSSAAFYHANGVDLASAAVNAKNPVTNYANVLAGCSRIR